MEIRDAVEGDAKALSEITDSPADVLRNVIHDRTVKVAIEDDEPIAFLSYDARPGTVYITQIGGNPDALEHLLSEPIRFADREGMDVELLRSKANDEMETAIEEAGFSIVEDGPIFEGRETVKYRREPHQSASKQ